MDPPPGDLKALTSHVEKLTGQVQLLLEYCYKQQPALPTEAKLLSHINHLNMVKMCVSKKRYKELFKYGEFYLDDFEADIDHLVQVEPVLLEHIIANTVDLNAVVFRNHTLARLACLNNLQCLTHLLLKYGANFNDTTSASPFMQAVSKGHLEVVKLLLNTANLNYKDKSGIPRHALAYATCLNNVELVDLLAEKLQQQGHPILPMLGHPFLTKVSVEHYLRLGVTPQEILSRPWFTPAMTSAALMSIKKAGGDLNGFRDTEGRSLIHLLLAGKRTDKSVILNELRKVGVTCQRYTGSLDLFTWASTYQTLDVILPYLIKDGVITIPPLITYIIQRNATPLIRCLTPAQLEPHRIFIVDHLINAFCTNRPHKKEGRDIDDGNSDDDGGNDGVSDDDGDSEDIELADEEGEWENYLAMKPWLVAFDAIGFTILVGLSSTDEFYKGGAKIYTHPKREAVDLWISY